MVTIALHVDDLLVTAKEQRLLEWLHRKLKEKYGEVTFNSGNRIKYLGIYINILENGNIELDCDDVWDTMLEEYQIHKASSIPAGRNLFKINEEAEALSDEERSEYLSRIMKVQYYAKKVRIDLLTTLAFLRTRVSVATVEDMSKLNKLLFYINATRKKRLCFSKSDDFKFEISVDTSHGTHQDRKGHTGIIARLGGSTIYATSTKQKLVARSSFESELIGLGTATQ